MYVAYYDAEMAQFLFKAKVYYVGQNKFIRGNISLNLYGSLV